MKKEKKREPHDECLEKWAASLKYLSFNSFLVDMSLTTYIWILTFEYKTPQSFRKMLNLAGKKTSGKYKE